MRKLSKQVDELHAWHNREDEDGVKVWYVRKSLEDAISKLADNLEQQTAVLSDMHRSLSEHRELDEKRWANNG